MRKLILPLCIAFLLVAVPVGLMQIAHGQEPDSSILSTEVQGENLREITAPAGADVPQSALIGFIDSPSATCYQPDPARNECYVNWYYLSVSASPNYMITMTLSLNAIGPVAHTQGFFQTSMYVPYNMLGKGFKVPCGAPGAGGDPLLGNAWAYTIRARASDGLSSANYGTVYCPPYAP